MLAVCYHNILPGKLDEFGRGIWRDLADRFRREIDWLHANFDVLPLSEALESMGGVNRSRRALTIPFDAGFTDASEQARPVMAKYGLTGTLASAAEGGTP